MDTKAIEAHVKGILEAIGEDPDREGLRETPSRVAKMFEEMLEGISYSNHEIAEMFGKKIGERFTIIKGNEKFTARFMWSGLALMGTYKDPHVGLDLYVLEGVLTGKVKIVEDEK